MASGPEVVGTAEAVRIRAGERPGPDTGHRSASKRCSAHRIQRRSSGRLVHLGPRVLRQSQHRTFRRTQLYRQPAYDGGVTRSPSDKKRTTQSDSDTHTHPHIDGHVHGHDSHAHTYTHTHSHGLVDDSIKRSREGIHAVAWSLAALGATAVLQGAVFASTGSVALFADLVHNVGDALTAVPLAIAFLMHSRIAEHRAGLAVVVAIFISACVAGVGAVDRLVNPVTPDHLVALGFAGAAGFAGNILAAWIRTRAGNRLASAALVADGHHARADAYVSLGVVASAAVVAAGIPIADPLIGLGITVMILRITWQSWNTVRRD